MLVLENISKEFKTFSLQNISFEVEKGDYFVLLGKSGSGKSVLLEIISGITPQSKGKIFYKNEDYSKKDIQKRNFVLVYQDLALFPHYTVYDNISYALKCHNISKSKHRNIINEMASFLEIEDLLHRMPNNLSGGEAQRVALARALVIKPDVLLLDEPLSSLDVVMKSDLQKLLKRINNGGQTIIHVTHDFEEAVALSNKVAIIEKGKIIQIGETDNVFSKPQNSFAARLSGVKNFFKVEFCDTNYDSNDFKTVYPENTKTPIKILSDLNSGSGYLAFHSKDVIISLKKIETTAINNFEGTVIEIHKKNIGIEVTVDIGIPITAIVSKHSFEKLNINEGLTLWVSFKASAPYFIPKN